MKLFTRSALRERVIEELVDGPVGRQILADAHAAQNAERSELAGQLAALEKRFGKSVGDLQAELQALEERAKDLRDQAIQADQERMKVAYRLTDLRDTWNGQRDRIWTQLLTMPDPQFPEFETEIQGRLDHAMMHRRSWTTKTFRAGESFTQHHDNHADVDAYQQALMHARDLIQVAIRQGFAGKSAASEITRIRNTLPAVRMSAIDHDLVTPSWPTAAAVLSWRPGA